MHTECHTGGSWHGCRLERPLGRSQAADKTQGAEMRCPGDTALLALRGDRMWFTYELRSQEAHVAGCECQLVTVLDKMCKFTEPQFSDLKWRHCHLPHGLSVKHCRFLSDVKSPWIV